MIEKNTSQLFKNGVITMLNLEDLKTLILLLFQQTDTNQKPTTSGFFYLQKPIKKRTFVI